MSQQIDEFDIDEYSDDELDFVTETFELQYLGELYGEGKPCAACFGTGLDRELDADCLTCWGEGVV
jgi:hypothetical protein